MAETPSLKRWEVVVEPVDDSSQDGVANLPAELLDQLAGTDVPYTLGPDRSITLHVSKAVKRA
ncbi:hypothetical protein GWQ43_07265 [Alcaligenes faecalis]|uniref:hypothetical protein n=1 Tax=Alcaligenes faecalis TaxID=511 RepID=UPI00137C2BEF|nr:hypothetical protein [Alcaligenes faecalis]QHS35871.1 hypothetical protein GWQ43_07265 [Alcaligenes faecalis]